MKAIPKPRSQTSQDPRIAGDQRAIMRPPTVELRLILLLAAAACILGTLACSSTGGGPHAGGADAGLSSYFHTTGNMTTARQGHTATLLPNGKVLIAGGGPGNELYDPTTGSFSSSGTMTRTRFGHTAVLLPNGKVLVAGGSGATGVLASAELYDPATSSFSPTGSMTTARFGHTATRLLNGQVLIAGGSGATDPLASAEFYDPTSGTFSPTGNMTTERFGHTATLLLNGKVLVAGGWEYCDDYCEARASVELYDPATGAFSPTGSMTVRRTSHSATLLTDGKVLVAGGYYSCDDVFGCHPIASAELYDPATASFSDGGHMTTARGGHSATPLSDGKVLVAGGYASGGYLTVSAELYDPATHSFSTAGSMTTARGGHSATPLSDGKVLVAGGNSFDVLGFHTTASAELFDEP
jgi:hypothetical protein